MAANNLLSRQMRYIDSFDSIARRYLDPVGHEVGSRTKGLVCDLGELRRILG